MKGRTIDQTRRGALALLLAWPALLLAKLGGFFGRRPARTAEPQARRTVSIVRYSFAVNALTKLGESSEFVAEGSPRTWLEPDTLIANVPCPNFLVLESVSIDGRELLTGVTDAFVFGPFSKPEQRIEGFPKLGPSSRVVVKGRYTGFVPPGYTRGMEYLLAFSFQGRGFGEALSEVA